MRDSRRHKCFARPRAPWLRTHCTWWWAVVEAGVVIGVMASGSAEIVEQWAGMRWPGHELTTRLWSKLTDAQRTAARAALPECRLIQE